VRTNSLNEPRDEGDDGVLDGKDICSRNVLKCPRA
jgi:hypothetical protein